MLRQSNRDVIQTYRYLRGAMVALLLLLLLSVSYQAWWESEPSCWLGSISAYYYTPARTIFVGSLFGLGAALIAYKGHTAEEDVLLNFSGFMALVVAMVPTVPDSSCETNGFSQTPAEIAMAVRNNIWSLIVATVIAVVVAASIKAIMAIKKNGAAKKAAGLGIPDTALPAARPGIPVVCISVLCSLVLVLELALFVALPDSFIALSHGIAAATMVIGVIMVMVLSALNVKDRLKGNDDRAKRVKRYQRIYIGLAAALGLLLGLTVVVSLAVSGFDHFILISEVIIIVLFGAYWIVQTYELRNLFEPATPDVPKSDVAKAEAPEAKPPQEIAKAEAPEAKPPQEIAKAEAPEAMTENVVAQ